MPMPGGSTDRGSASCRTATFGLAGRPQERTLTLRLEEVHRPVAFSTPLASNDLEAVCTFDPLSESAIHRVLLQFERWLQPMLFKAALGALIIERGTTLRGSIYHVMRQATLLAVLDFRHGHAAILPTAIAAGPDRCPLGPAPRRRARAARKFHTLYASAVGLDPMRATQT
jgi:hypothetical protein